MRSNERYTAYHKQQHYYQHSTVKTHSTSFNLVHLKVNMTGAPQSLAIATQMITEATNGVPLEQVAMNAQRMAGGGGMGGAMGGMGGAMGGMGMGGTCHAGLFTFLSRAKWSKCMISCPLTHTHSFDRSPKL